MKAYTNLSQSRKLAEILPSDSADMWWSYYYDVVSGSGEYDKEPLLHKPSDIKHTIPCWSLAALLSALPYPSLHKTFYGWRCDSYNKEGTSCKLGNPTDNPVDACYDMIIKLHEQKLL